MIVFECEHNSGKRKQHWSGELRVISQKEKQMEAEVNVDGSYYHLIIGNHKYGNYLCIPNWDIGCELSSYGDTFWNTERISKHLRMRAAISIAMAVKAAGSTMSE